MKRSLKALATATEAKAAPEQIAAEIETSGKDGSERTDIIELQPKKKPAPAKTRLATRQISGHFPAEDIKAFRVLAASHDMDVQELLAEALNMLFERYQLRNRVPVTSGRRTKRSA